MTYKIEPAGCSKWKAIDQDRKTVKTFTSEAAAQEWLNMAQPKKAGA